jgi:hypothetical protein
MKRIDREGESGRGRIEKKQVKDKWKKKKGSMKKRLME